MYTIIVTDLYSDDPISGTTTYQMQKDSVTIGRSRANEVVIRQTNISTKHLSITHTGSSFMVRDLNSTNGTKVNKRPLQGEIQVYSDDQIEIGGALIRLTGHPDLDRNSQGSSEYTDDEDDYDMPEASDYKEDNSFDALIPQETGGSPLGQLPGNTGFGGGEDFRLSAIAPSASVPDSDSPRPSISLDNLFNTNGGRLESDSDSDFNPFPVDAAGGAMSMSVVQEGPEQDALLDKIKKLESRMKKGASPGSRAKPKGVPLADGSVLLPPKDRNRGRRAPTPYQDEWQQQSAPQGAPMPSMPIMNTPASNPFGSPPVVPGETKIVVETRNASAKNAKSTSKEYAKGRVVIGRNPECDVCLSSSYISGRHLSLEIDNGVLMVKDLGSTNGSYLNSQDLKEPAVLNEDDEIKIGEFVIHAHIQAAASSSNAGGGMPFPSELGMSNPAAPFPSVMGGASGGNVGAPSFPGGDNFPGGASGISGGAGSFPGGDNFPDNVGSIPGGAGSFPGSIPGGGGSFPGGGGSFPGGNSNIPAGTALGSAVSAGAPSPGEIPRGISKEQLKGNFSAVAIQLYLARKAIGHGLDDLQNSEFEAYEIRETCQAMAQAVKILYRSRDLENDFETIQGVVDAVLEKLSSAVALVYHHVGYNDPSIKDLYRAYALILPLSSEGVAAFEENGAMPGLSLLSEMGYLGMKHKSVCPTREALLQDKIDIDGVLLAGSKFTNSIEYLPCVRSLARSVSDIMFLDFEDQLKLENVVDEACTNIIEHSFDTQGNDSFYVSFVVMQDNRLAIAVDDMGLPINVDEFNRGAVDGLGFKLIRAFCSEAQFINRGRKGKRLLMMMDLPERFSGVNFHDIINNKNNGLIADSSKNNVQLATPDLAEEIPACVFRAHRYNYFDETLYSARDLFAKIQSGNLIAAVVVNANNVVIGYMSIVLESPKSRVGELGAAIVVPQMNTAAIGSSLTAFLIEESKRRGMLGLNILMTASHPYEQIAHTNLGLKNTGMMFNHLPANEMGTDAGARRRQSMVSAYLKLNDGPAQQVCLPTQYAAMLKAVYQNLGLNRQLLSSDAKQVTLPAISNVRIVANPALGYAFIKIVEVGDDIVQVIRNQLLSLQKTAIAVYLDIPLSTPTAQVVCNYLERSRACFSSLVPDTDMGDLLRLQLSGFEVDISALHVEGDFGKSILKGIAQQHVRITGLI